jgi:hypothetical protein
VLLPVVADDDLQLMDGVIDVTEGVVLVAAEVVPGLFQFVPRLLQLVQGVVDVREVFVGAGLVLPVPLKPAAP